MPLIRIALTAGIVVAAVLPMAGTAAAEQGTVAGLITATDYSSGLPALVALDPASGEITGPLVPNAEDGVLSPAGSALAYVQRDDTCIPQTEGCMYARNLVVADADGGDQHVLVPGIEPETSEAPYVARPDWSPDGQRIVYDSPRGMEWVNSDGTGQEVLTGTGGAGTFSPDGQSIAFVRTTGYETPDGWESSRDVWAMDTATRQMHQISAAGNAMYQAVDWSPDGQRIAYATDNGLSVVDVATGAVTEVQNGWTTPLSSIRGPVFSPDGARIAFWATNSLDSTHGTYVADAADGRNLQALTAQFVVPTDWLNR